MERLTLNMMKKLYTIGLLLLGGSFSQVMAQTLSPDEQTIFEAMSDELQRNKQELESDNTGKPFFISYMYSVSSRFNISGSLGAINNSNQSEPRANGAVKLLLGDHHRTHEMNYPEKPMQGRMPSRPDYNEIRRNFWLMTDGAYKMAQYALSSKKSRLLSNPPIAEEATLDDFDKLETPVTKMVESVPFEYSQEEWEKNIRELSAIFKDYKEIFNSSVIISGLQTTMYNKTSEGVTLRQPTSYITLSAHGSIRAEDGMILQDSYSRLMGTPQDCPSLEELKKQIKNFAERLMKLREVEPIADFYSGPVLFEGGAVVSVLTRNLLYQGGLFAFRKQGNGGPMMDREMDKRIIDERISIKNYTVRQEYKNTPLLGAYQVDAEGIIPDEEMLLVENGILRKQLNGRFPTLTAKRSTGSSRFLSTDREASYTTAPGTIHFIVQNGLKQERMKAALIKAAKKGGHTHAYIVRNLYEQGSLVYRVDVKDGSETIVRGGYIPFVKLDKIRRVAEISSTEYVANYLLEGKVLSSLIYPSSILFEKIEISKPDPKKDKPFPLLFPSQRE